MKDEQIAKLKVKALHFPTVLGAVVPVYNVPGVSGELKFTPEALAGIYLGDVKKWNDAKLTSANPGVKLPNEDIIPVHRAEGSGTTFVWCDYLAKVSSAWKSKIGGACATALQWPASGLAGQGNDGVTGTREADSQHHRLCGTGLCVEPTSDLRIGEEFLRQVRESQCRDGDRGRSRSGVERASRMISACRSPMPRSGQALTRSLRSPTCSFPSKIPDAAKKKAIKDFLAWMLTTGVKRMRPGVHFAPLPQPVAAKEQKRIAQKSMKSMAHHLAPVPATQALACQRVVGWKTPAPPAR